MPCIRHGQQPNSERQINQGIDQQARRWTEQKHHAAADSRTEENPELAARRIEPHRALKMFRPDDVMDQQLAPGSPEHSGHAVNHEQYAGMPDFDGIRIKQVGPRRRHTHVHDLRHLDDLAAVEAVRQRAEIDGEQQKRRPVRQHSESGKGRRLKFLIEQPVADHMLDIVRHHRQHGADEVQTKILVMERRKSDFLACDRCRM